MGAIMSDTQHTIQYIARSASLADMCTIMHTSRWEPCLIDTYQYQPVGRYLDLTHGEERVRSFFFQAEDGIRDWSVTGVQTCALFFSSRRRHTRLVSDWSSDVCSSDLKQKTAYEIGQ